MEFKYSDFRFYAEDDKGRLVAEITFPPLRDNERVLNANHTFVTPPLRNKGVASDLVLALVEKAKSEDYKIRATCPYVISWFKRNPSYNYLLEAS